NAPLNAIDWVVENSGGSPLHIKVLARHWEVTRTLNAPTTIVDAVHTTLAERSSAALRLLHLLSAARLCRSLPCLERLSGHSLTELYVHLSELEGADLIELRESTIRLVHPLIGDVLTSMNGEAANA